MTRLQSIPGLLQANIVSAGHLKAKCIATRRTSPLEEGEEVQVVDIAPADECMCEMFVEVSWSGRTLAVPLAQLEALEVDDETREAVEDWHYWVARGYQF